MKITKGLSIRANSNKQIHFARKQTGFTVARKQTGFTFARKQTGFTLVELLIYMGLLVILILIFTEIFSSIIENQLSSTNTSNVADDGRYIYSRFIYDVGRADAILEPELFGSTSANLVLDINGEIYTYSTSSGNIVIEDPRGTYQLNGYGSVITDLLFTKIGTNSAEDTVQVNFTINGNVQKAGISDQQIFQTTAGLR